MTEEAKKIRTVAKARFTRKKNEFLKSIQENKGIETVKGTFAELNEAWNIVEGEHDIYTIHLEEEEIEQSETWINELQNLFSEAATTYAQYVSDQTQLEAKQREEIDRQESNKIEHEKLQRFLEKTEMKRKSLETIFQTLVDYARSLTESYDENKNALTALKKVECDMEAALADCKAFHNRMLELLDDECIEREIEWIRDMHARYNTTCGMIETFISTKETNSKNAPKQSSIRLEKIKMPTFDGEIRHYPQFKRDFEKQVLPTISTENAPYILRSCLGKEPLDVVRSVDDDVGEMWKRLDEKYGDPAKVADVVIDSIQSVKTIKEGENKKLITFINIVEDGYRDLQKLGLEKEITTTSSVSVIEKKLPADMRKE